MTKPRFRHFFDYDPLQVKQVIHFPNINNNNNLLAFPYTETVLPLKHYNSIK